MLLQVPIQAVVGDIGVCALEPVDVQVVLLERPVQNAVPFLNQLQVLVGLFAPKPGGSSTERWYISSYCAALTFAWAAKSAGTG